MNTSRDSILYIISSLVNQGPVQELYDLIAYLDFEKYDVTLLTLSKEDNNSLIEQFTKLPIKIIQTKNINKYNFYELYRILNMHIVNNHIDIIHSHCFRSLILASLFRKHLTCIHSIYIYPGLQAKSMNGKLIGMISNFITKYLIKRIQYPIACSKSVSEELFVKDKIKVEYIRNGITPFKENAGEKNDFKRQLGLDTNNRYFISIGRLSPEKNFYTMIEAFKKADIKGFKLIIIGDGILMETLQQTANENIILAGFKRNISEFLAASDFYITTSLTEGMALSTIYAMASGLPLLLSEIPPHKEIIELSEKNEIGIIFYNSRQKSIVDAIQKMAEYPSYNELSVNVTNVFTSHFTAEKMSKSYQKLYDSALNLSL